MVGASGILKDDQDVSTRLRRADKYAFSSVRSVEPLEKDCSNFVPKADTLDFHDVSPKQSSIMFTSRSSVSGEDSPKQTTSLQSNIVVILALVLAIIIKLLELLEGVLTKIVFMVNGAPRVCQNKHGCLHSGAGSSGLCISSNANKIPVCFYESSKEEDSHIFKVATGEEKKSACEEVQANIVETLDNSDVIVSKVVANDVFVTNAVLEKVVDPDVPVSHSKVNIDPVDDDVLLDSPVLGDVNDKFSKVETEVKRSSPLPETSLDDNLIKSHPVTGVTADSVDSICFPFVADSSVIPISIEGYSFGCLVDTGAAITAVKVV